MIRSWNIRDHADTLVLVASEVTGFEAFARLGVCRIGIYIGSIASTDTADRMRDIVSEDSLRIVVTGVSRGDKACIHTACCNIILENDIVGRLSTEVRIVSPTSLLIDCHINEVQDSCINITNEVTRDRGVSELGQIDTHSSIANKCIVDNLNIITVDDRKSPVEAIVDG